MKNEKVWVPWLDVAVHAATDVFALLRDGRAWTRAELAQTTGLARSTVAARVDELMRLGLVAPRGGTSTGGRPPSLFTLNHRARVVAGADVGASHVGIVIADLSGEVLDRASAQLDVAEGPEAVLSWVCGSITALLERQGRAPEELAAVGIGLPGPVEHSSGRPINPPIMPGWDRYDVPGRVQQDHSVPVLIDNDVNIMALGERRTVFPGVQDLVFVKVATGIGSGLISGGMLQRGAQGTAGDLGHVRVPRADDIECRCGNTGCLEAVASGPALAAALTQAGVPAPTPQDVVDLVRAGDVSAVQVVRQAGRDLGDVLATVVNLFNPAVVVIGGRMAGAGEHLLAGIREIVYQRSMPLATEHLRVVPSALAGSAALDGAVAMAVEHVLSPEQIESAVRHLG
jgi:predicted NBD/HSP70 family sugar kinase